jgi:predicted aspartyl protease
VKTLSRLIAALFLACTPIGVQANTSNLNLNCKNLFEHKEIFEAELEFLHKTAVNYLKIDDSSGVVAIPISINGKRTFAIVDTGFTNSVLDTNLARELSIPICRTDFDTKTSFSSMEKYVSGEVAIEVEGQFRVSSPFSSHDLGAISKNLNKPIGFIIGMDLLGSIAFVIDGKRKEIVFTRSGKAKVKSPHVIEFIMENGTFPAIVNSQVVRAQIDTGSDNKLSIYAHSWKYVFGDADPEFFIDRVDASGTSFRARGMRNVHFSIGGITGFVDPTISMLEEPSADVSIGYRFFSDRITLFDFPAGKVLIFE